MCPQQPPSLSESALPGIIISDSPLSDNTPLDTAVHMSPHAPMPPMQPPPPSESVLSGIVISDSPFFEDAAQDTSVDPASTIPPLTSSPKGVGIQEISDTLLSGIILSDSLLSDSPMSSIGTSGIELSDRPLLYDVTMEVTSPPSTLPKPSSDVPPITSRSCLDPKGVSLDTCNSQSIDAVELQAEVGPDSHHSPSVSPVDSTSSAPKDEKCKLKKFVLKDPINWPPATNAEAWNNLDKRVFNNLPAEGSVDIRLRSLEEGIYNIGLELFGIKTFRPGSDKSRRRCVKKTMQLVAEKNALQNDLKVCDFAKKEGLLALLDAVRIKLRIERKKERHTRRKWKAKILYRKFIKDPFDAGRQILSPSPNCKLVVDQETMDLHLENVCGDSERDIPLPPLEGLPEPPKIKKKFQVGGFLRAKFDVILKKKRNKSAPGINRIPYTVYKRCPNLADYLFLIVNICGPKKYVPLAWRAAMETYIPKGEKPVANCIDDFRPIALANVEGKIFWSLVSQRLISHLVDNNKIIDTSVQKGCLAKTPGVWEHVSMVWSALQKTRSAKENLATVWLDIANAYGTIPHQLIFFALKRYGVTPHCIKLIRSYYDGLWSKSFSENAPSDWHQHKRGIFAGCTLSIALFIAGMNIVIEFVNNCSVDSIVVESLQLPRLRAFMDDLNLMSPSVKGTSVLLNRCCTALTWAKMKFKAAKSRYVVIKAGRTVCPAISPFGIPVVESEKEGCIDTSADSDMMYYVTGLPAAEGDRIPSIHDNPVRFLGRIIDGSLTDRKNTEDLWKKAIDGLLLIDRCSLKGSQKLWICHHLLMKRIQWSLLIYEITMNVAAKLEKKVSVYIRKWLKIPKCMSSVCLFSTSSPCPLPLQSVTSMLKSTKVCGFQQLNYSKDPLVSKIPPPTTPHAPYKVTTKASSDAELLKMAKGLHQTSDARKCPVSGINISERHLLPCLRICPMYNLLSMSGTPVNLKAGDNWDVEKASRDAECEVQVKKIVGVTRTSRAGLGSLKYSRIPKSKHSSEYRKAVGTAVKEQVERELSAKAANESLQCQWSNWTSYIQNDLRWADILAMPPDLLSFCLNATFNTLPSPSNLERWNIQTESVCNLCSHSPCTVPHVLSGCKFALNQGRYEFRHDRVLRELVVSIKEFVKNMKDQENGPSIGIEFVIEGRAPRTKRSGRKDGRLRVAHDWKLTADLDDQKNYVFPSYLATTRQRPDILLESPSTRRVVLIELTCPSEENFARANEYKRGTYKTLLKQIKGNDWYVDYFPIEVGARGYCAENVRTLFSFLGYSGKQTKALLKVSSRTSLIASFTIWLSRGSLVWNPEGGQDAATDPSSQDPAQSSTLPLCPDSVATQTMPAVQKSGSTIAPEKSPSSFAKKSSGKRSKKTTYPKLLKSGNKVLAPTPAQIPPPVNYTSNAPATDSTTAQDQVKVVPQQSTTCTSPPMVSKEPAKPPPPKPGVKRLKATNATKADRKGLSSAQPHARAKSLPPSAQSDGPIRPSKPAKPSGSRSGFRQPKTTHSTAKSGSKVPTHTQAQVAQASSQDSACKRVTASKSTRPTPSKSKSKVSAQDHTRTATHIPHRTGVQGSAHSKISSQDTSLAFAAQSVVPSRPKKPASKLVAPKPVVCRSPVPTGIVNKGNTCYVSVILQSLSVFSEYYSVCPERTSFLKSFLNTMKLLSEKRSAPVDPLVFLTHLQLQMRTTIRDFAWNTQQDVPHILSVLMDRINAESAIARQLSEIPVRTVTTCSVCNFKSANVKPQQYLMVPVRDSLSAMMSEFSSEQVVEGDNGYLCPQCSPTQKQKAFQRDEIASAPLMMVLVLRRYEKSNQQGSLQPTFVRSTQHINHCLPLEVCVKTGSGVEQKAKYEAVSVIHHTGSLSGCSHYIAHVRKDHTWFRCNDRRVTASVPKNIGSDTSYVIFCKRVTMH